MINIIKIKKGVGEIGNRKEKFLEKPPIKRKGF